MEIIGWAGTALVIAAYFPQIRHLYVEKCAWGISLATWWIWLVSSALLLTYAALDGSTMFVLVQAINMLAIAATIVLAKRSENVCPYHQQTATLKGASRRMLYPDRMATHRNKKNSTVDPKLRRKMLERWENEGGKIGELDPTLPPSASKELRAPIRKTHSEGHPAPSK